MCAVSWSPGFRVRIDTHMDDEVCSEDAMEHLQRERC